MADPRPRPAERRAWGPAPVNLWGGQDPSQPQQHLHPLAAQRGGREQPPPPPASGPGINASCPSPPYPAPHREQRGAEEGQKLMCANVCLSVHKSGKENLQT